jgi:hypothetical protein
MMTSGSVILLGLTLGAIVAAITLISKFITHLMPRAVTPFGLGSLASTILVFVERSHLREWYGEMSSASRSHSRHISSSRLNEPIYGWLSLMFRLGLECRPRLPALTLESF